MSRISTLKRSIRTAAAAFVFVGLLAPANANSRHDAVSIFPDLPISTTADNSGAKAPVERNPSMMLTSRLPWLAPVGHRQPQRTEVPQLEAVSAWERQQRQFDQELDRRLIICRGC